MTIHWKAVEQYFSVELFIFQVYPVCNFVKLVDFDLALSEMKVLIILDKSLDNFLSPICKKSWQTVQLIGGISIVSNISESGLYSC